jgi:sugar/nucleoside kinase (ribokinase family)
MVEIITVGEALIDFVSCESGATLAEATAFEKAFGGAPANVAVGLARLGTETGFIGKLGEDQFGDFLANTLRSEGVLAEGLVFDPLVRTTLAFVSLTEEGERDFMFYRHPGSDMLLRQEEIRLEILEPARIVHFGSLSLTHEPARSAVFYLVSACKRRGQLISFDPNLRLSLWSSREEARVQIGRALEYADIVKFSEDELAFLTGNVEPEIACRRVFSGPIKLMFVSLGKEGCYYYNGKSEGRVKGFEVEVVDTTGAGDGFTAGVLANLLPLVKEGRDLKELGDGELFEIGRFANAVGATIVGKRGAVSGAPYWEEVMDFLSRHG